jgi:hypothetical protein
MTKASCRRHAVKRGRVSLRRSLTQCSGWPPTKLISSPGHTLTVDVGYTAK